jgi:hypothetical protein
MGVWDAAWRAAAYCLHGRVIALSLLPLLVAGGGVAAAGWWGWELAVDAVRQGLESAALLDAFLKWLEAALGVQFRAVLAPLLVVALGLPLIVLASGLIVAWLMAPACVRLVAQRRFPDLQRLAPPAAAWRCAAWVLGCALVALFALALSLPLWLLPPLALVLPPLVWAWLTAQVFGYCALAQHASVAERRALLARYRFSLFCMGLACGLLASAPSLLWLGSAASFMFAPLLAVASVWLYTLVFAFAALWFAHRLLAALAAQRAAAAVLDPGAAAPVALAESPAASQATAGTAESGP